MAKKKLIAVAGATGAQGGGLVRAILSDPDRGFAVRALTRDPNSLRAVELARLGAEVVAANVDDADSVARALDGAAAAYCVTFYWDHFSPSANWHRLPTWRRPHGAPGLPTPSGPPWKIRACACRLAMTACPP